MSNTLKIDSSPEQVRKRAESYIITGKYHCAESVLLSVTETLGLPVDLRYISGFGGGLGNTKCVCGAYSGSVVALNLIYGADKRSLELSQSRAVDATLDKAIHRFEESFKKQYNYSCCKLLTKDVVWGSPEHFKHCVKLTGDTAATVWNLIVEIEKEKAANPSN